MVVNLQLVLRVKRFLQKILEPTVKVPINVGSVDGLIYPIPLTQSLSFLPWVCPACGKEKFGHNNKHCFMSDLGTCVCSRCENRLRTDPLYYDDVKNTFIARDINNQLKDDKEGDYPWDP